MRYFKQYVSNTCAGSANQFFFSSDGECATSARAFYKINVGGEFDYSFLFSNIIDSTYSNGAQSHANLVCDEWQIISARVGKGKFSLLHTNIAAMTLSDENEGVDTDITVYEMSPLSFGGNASRTVAPGEFFSTDPIRLKFDKGDYLCIEITFSGDMIPYHEESLLPIYVKDNDGWHYSRRMPLPSMIGCTRPVKARIAYLGDSITQGIGAPHNSYLHWSARLSDMLGDEYSYWNLGIGYGRASDAASDGAWLYKAKQCDIIFVCYGTNDILQGHSEEKIKQDISTITDKLKALGKTVILQTLPPFNYTGDNKEKWLRINEFIKSSLSERADLVFDTVPFLSDKSDEAIAIFGDHPNAEGSAAWAEGLFSAASDIIHSKG